MTAPVSDTVLRGSLRALALVATRTGLSVALGGPALIPGGAPTAASNDSVLRFYAGLRRRVLTVAAEAVAGVDTGA